MKSTHTFSVSFFLKKDKAKNGKAPLFARVTVDGTFTDISTKQRVDTSAWNQGKQTLSGNGMEEVMIREKMRLLINDLNNAYNDLRHENIGVNAESIKARTEGRDNDQCSLIFLMNYHNTELASLIEPGTLKNYFSTERFLQEFLIRKKNVKDIYLDKIDNKFITDFGIYMLNRVPDKGQKPCGNNTLMKHMERFKKVFGVALKNGWTMNQPFLHFERKIIHKDRECLEIEELNRIKAIEGLKSGQLIVRDLFIFCCLTGLAYCDLVNLAKKHLIRDNAGEYWIEMIRQKNRNFTQHKFHVLLLPEALEIIERAASGIGKAIALTFGAHGAKVVVSDLNELEGQKVSEEISQNGGEAIYIKADTSVPSDQEKLVDQTVKHFGGLHVSVNNAGIGGSIALTGEYPIEGWDKVISVNLSGVFYALRYQIPAILSSGGGSIVNMASVLGQVGMKYSPAYVAAKHGVLGLTKSAALEYAQQGIRINSVAPGYVNTALLTDNLSQEQIGSLTNLHPMNRLGESQEIAELVLWLSSEKASFVTGSCYTADGGYLAQ